MRAIAIFSGVLLILGSWVAVIIFHYQIDRDINGWQVRAQVSSEPNDMVLYLENTRQGIERWGMTSGYGALIFYTPENDMALIYRTVKQQAEQAKILTAMARDTPEYQTGLDNLRGAIRELKLQTLEYWSYHQELVFWFLLPGAGTVLIILGSLVTIGVGSERQRYASRW